MLIGKRQLPFFFSIGILIILSVLYFAFTARHLIQTHFITGIVTTVIASLLFLFTLVNFLVTSFIDPGFYPINVENDEYEIIQHGVSKNITVKGGSTFSMRWCDECKHYRPPRSHHCSVCEMCVEHFDHHCPWVDNCIGMKNYRYFVLFISSLIIYALVGVGCSVAAIVLMKENLVEVIMEFVLCVLLVIFLIPIFILAAFHIYLMIIGKTTFEQIKSEEPSPYNRGFMCNLYLTFFTPTHPKYQKFEPSRTVRHQIATLERDRNAEPIPDCTNMIISSAPEVVVRMTPASSNSLHSISPSVVEKMNRIRPLDTFSEPSSAISDV